MRAAARGAALARGLAVGKRMCIVAAQRASNRVVLVRWIVCRSMPDRTDLNVTRRLTRMLKASGLPRSGRAHCLRMRYVQQTHVLLILQKACTRGRIVMAMRNLLEGWADTEEEHPDYHRRLLNLIHDVEGQIERWVYYYNALR